jgi:hypothetical protein
MPCAFFNFYPIFVIASAPSENLTHTPPKERDKKRKNVPGGPTQSATNAWEFSENQPGDSRGLRMLARVFLFVPVQLDPFFLSFHPKFCLGTQILRW